MNMLPVQTHPGDPATSTPPSWSSPMKLFYESRPDYRVLFSFGCIGYFNRVNDGPCHSQTFKAHTFAGIALGRSDLTNALIFFNPDLKDFVVSSNFVLDTDCSIQDAFPSLVYEGGLQLSLYKGCDSARKIYPPGTPVYCNDHADLGIAKEGVVVGVSTSQCPTY